MRSFYPTTKAAVLALAGALGALAMPPWGWWPLLVPAFGVLTVAIESARTRRAAAVRGWLFGAGFFGVGIGWVAVSFRVDPALAPFGPPAAAMLAAGLAVFVAGAAALVREAVRRGAPGPLALAGAWTLLELARAHALSGFPWNFAASVWSFADAPLQAIALVGPYGLGFLTIAAAAAAARARSGALLRRVAALGALPALAVALWTFGTLRLPTIEPPATGPMLRIVQPGVDQRLKWDPAERDRILATLIGLSTAGAPPDLLVWPESATPVLLQDAPALAQAIGGALAPGGVALVGAVRRDETGRVFNSVVALDATGSWRAVYDKARLVPFGEFVPLRGLLRFGTLTAGRIDFTPGPGPVVMQVDGAPPFQPLICYEAIFPAFRPAERPAWLLNVTNDAWFGLSAGPWQHLASARMRAVEQGLPLVRAANTGVSVVTDAYGRVLARLGLGEQGVLDVPLPSPLEQPTPYARLGDLPAVAAALLALLPGVRLRRVRGT
jgi:apolipoprotein N-acyltransferase